MGAGPLLRAPAGVEDEGRERDVREDDEERHRDVVFHVVRVANGERRDCQQGCRDDARPLSEQSAAQRVGRDDREHAAESTERPASREDGGRIHEERSLEGGDGWEGARDGSGDEERPFPREQRVKVQRRIEKVVRVQSAGRERERAIHDRDFVRVVDGWQAVIEARHAEDDSRDDGQSERQRAAAASAPWAHRETAVRAN